MMLLTRYTCWILILFVGLSASAQQSISVTAEKSNIILGEPLKLNVRIVGDKISEAVIPDSLGHFEILKIEPVENRNSGGKIITNQQLLVTCFDSGRFRIPPISISGNEGIVSAGFDVMVTPLPADSTKSYGDIKQIINIDVPDQLPYQIAMAVLMLLSGWMIWRLIQKQQETVYEAPVSTPVVTPLHSIIEQLSILKQQWQLQQTNSVELGNELMDISKKFFAGRGIYSKSKTGEELIVATKSRFDADTWMGIAQTIRLCNAMRFGKFEATMSEGMEGIGAIEKTIQPYYGTTTASTSTINKTAL